MQRPMVNIPGIPQGLEFLFPLDRIELFSKINSLQGKLIKTSVTILV
jgi:hypothetical protein